MYACHCRYNRCNGKLQPRSTRNNHLSKDRQTDSRHGLHLAVSLSDNTPQSLRTPAVDTPINFQPPNHHLTQHDLPVSHPPPPSHPLEDYHIDDPFSFTASLGAQFEDEDRSNASEASEEDADEEVDAVDRPAPTIFHTSAQSATPLPSSFVDPGDPIIPDENFPDPFQVDAVLSHDTPAISHLTTPTPLFLIYLLVSWLHTHFHLPFLACNAILVVNICILQALNAEFLSDTFVYSTLTSLLLHTGIEPKFLILPVCPSCLEVYPSTTPADVACSRCNSPLFVSRRSLGRRAGPNSDNQRPCLQFPMKSIESQLRDILAVPGMEEILDGWRSKPRTPGKMTDIFDGEICKTLPASDGRPFFENPLPPAVEELRIGLTMGVDWFSYLRSLISASHSSCPMSFVIANFPSYLKYRTSNMILAAIMPGPKEQNPDQIQRFMRIFINELIRLWRHGFFAKTLKHPLGILVRVVLLCVICDKPAAHKLGGFGSHSHTFFCTRCWINVSQKASAAAFQTHVFPPQTHQEHVKLGADYAKCDSQSAQADFVKQFATRWSELGRLPYFDICRQVIVDLMHNLLLGLVKTHFYHIWIQQKVLRKTKELRRLHDILSKLQIPSSLGRLPNLMGEPAGGSLTADQWLLAATIVCPVAVPQIWDEFATGDGETIRLRRIGAINEAIQKKKAARAAARKVKQAAAAAAATAPRRSQRKRKRTARSQFECPELPEDDPDDAAIPDAGAIEEVDDIFPSTSDNEAEDDGDINRDPNLHPDDPGNFLKLSRALRLLVAREITNSQAQEADQLLRAYCLELLELYGPSVIRPNHHYCTHILECVQDFGPLHEFWTFLFERINKVLKSYKTSNHAGGELETSFFREFHRTIQQSRMMAASYSGGNDFVKASIDAMYRATADDRGTVQALARELDNATVDAGVAFSLSPKYFEGVMSSSLYAKVLNHLRVQFGLSLRSHIAISAERPLFSAAFFFDYVVISQSRYYASNRGNNIANSLIVVKSSGPTGAIHVGELLDIITIKQLQLGRIFHFGHVRWLIPAQVLGIEDSAWSSRLEDIGLWQLNAFDEIDTPLIPLDSIQQHVIRSEVNILGSSYWATVTPS